MTVSVKRRDDVDRDAFDDFVDGHPSGMLYYTPRYLDFLGRVTHSQDETLVVTGVDGSIEGVMPLFRKDGPLGSVLNSSPFFGSHGAPIVISEQARSAVLGIFSEISRADGVASSTVIENPLLENKLQLDHDHLDTRIGQFTQLDSADPDNLIMAIDGSARRNIKKAQRAGITVSIENDMLPFIASCHSANMKEMGGTPKPNVFFDEVQECFEAGQDFDVHIARKDGEPVSGLLLFYANAIAEYFVPVTLEGHRSEQPLPLIIASAMAESAKRGFRLWNWGGTWKTQTGVYRFKKKWNAFEAEYRYYTCIREENVYSTSSEDLLRDYDGFYVVPFSTLGKGVVEPVAD